MNRYKYNSAYDISNNLAQVINNIYNETTQTINGAVNETVTLDRRGLTIIDINDSNKFLRGTHGVIGITSDGGNNFKNAITSDGIIKDKIKCSIINF